MQAGEREQSGVGALRQRPNPASACELTSICRLLENIEQDAHPGVRAAQQSRSLPVACSECWLPQKIRLATALCTVLLWL